MVSRLYVFCAHCGNWLDEDAPPHTRYCCEECRIADQHEIHRILELTLIRLLSDGPTDAILDPADVSAAVVGVNWREHEHDARKAARRLAHDGVVMCIQGTEWIDPTAIEGPFVIMRGPFWHENQSKLAKATSNKEA